MTIAYPKTVQILIGTFTLGAALVAGRPAEAALVRADFSGVVTSVVDFDGVLPGAGVGIAPDDIMTGSLIYDSAAADQSAASGLGIYRFASAPSQLTLSIGGFTFLHDFASDDLEITIQDNAVQSSQPDGTPIIVADRFTAAGSGSASGFPPDLHLGDSELQIVLQSVVNVGEGAPLPTSFIDDDLPLFLDLSDFISGGFTLRSDNDAPFPDLVSWSINGNFTSFVLEPLVVNGPAPVPAPGTLWTLAAGLLSLTGLAVRRRRRC